MAANTRIDATPLLKQTVETVLRILRQQRDTKQIQILDDTYDFNPQIFKTGKHFIDGPIIFRNPFRRFPRMTFGSISQKVIEDTTVLSDATASGFTPPIIYPYVYGFQQASASISGFYLGLYALTTIPESATSYTISWHAKGIASAYPQQRIGEAWTSAYNQNEADYLINNVSS